ncbi:hypothetical protein [Kurthia gibsonii]|uniref:hypothetical protein n=1 Tax=Kurthia gibsonii TaxID=33946 RepID=UPI0030160B11
MAKSQAVYDLFQRNWYNRRATEVELDLAVEKGLLDQVDKIKIMQSSQMILI